MHYRLPNPVEETILKRSFSTWGIFELYGKEKLIVATPSPSVNPKKGGLQIKDQDVQNKPRFLDFKILPKVNSKKKFQNHLNGSNQLKVYLCSPSLENANNFMESSPILMGLQIGIISNKKFAPGLNFAEIILNNHRNRSLEFPHVIINEKAANLVCFGRDIMGNSVISCYKKIKDNQILIILNKDKEVLGIGRSRFSGELLCRPNVITVNTIEDIGTFYLQNENMSTR